MVPTKTKPATYLQVANHSDRIQLACAKLLVDKKVKKTISEFINEAVEKALNEHKV